MRKVEKPGKKGQSKRDLTTVQGPTKGATSILALSQAMSRSDNYRRILPHAKIGEVFGGKAAVKTSCTFLCLMFIWFPFIGWNWISADMPLSEERDHLTYCKSLGGVFAWMYEKDILVVTCETSHSAQQELQDGFASVQVWIKGMCGHKYHSAAGAIFSEQKQPSALISAP